MYMPPDGRPLKQPADGQSRNRSELREVGTDSTSCNRKTLQTLRRPYQPVRLTLPSW
jgi:hypothetical protein